MAREFHEATKHSPERLWSSGHRLDRRNKPHPFKVYEDAEGIDLPRPLPELGVGAVEALYAPARQGDSARPDFAGLARLLAYGAGLLRRVTYSDGETFHFRTYASAGALYPVEIYVVNEAMEGLDAGVYHFDPLGFRLIRLRGGDHRGLLAEATVGEESVPASRLALVLTALPWRTAWKYTERGYRHLFWDAGMILANVFALAGSARWTSRVVMGFVDADVSALLGVDGTRELPLSVLSLGAGGSASRSAQAPERLTIRSLPLSSREIEFEAITGVNEASSLQTRGDVAAWRLRLREYVERPSDGARPGVKENGAAASDRAPTDSLEVVIRRRGSARVFRRGSMSLDALRRTLRAATGPIATDYAPLGARLVEPYLIVNAVDGFTPGAYVYRDDDFVLLREGNFRTEAGYLCLEQRLGADAAATIFLMTDLEGILNAAGDRGYRVAQMEGGIVGGRIYLGAYAHRFGATGLTFYDDLVTEFFSPDAAGKSCLLVVAVGESPRLTGARRPRASSRAS